MTARQSADVMLSNEVLECGDGPTVGYLHGPLGNPYVHPFLEELAAHGHRVVAPNLPGFGGSEPRAARNIHDWAFLASEAIDRAGLAGRPMVSASVGAMLALEVAALRPEVFERLIVIAPLGLWDSEHPVHDVWAERTSDQPGFFLERPENAARFFEKLPDAEPEEQVEWEMRRYRTRRSAAALMWPIPEFGLSDRLYRVQCPVSVVWGSEDRIAPAWYAAELASRLTTSVAPVIVEGVGHCAEWDDPSRLADVVAAVLIE